MKNFELEQALCGAGELYSLVRVLEQRQMRSAKAEAVPHMCFRYLCFHRSPQAEFPKPT